MPSPRPKPTALRVLEGNRGKRPLNDREPKPVVCLPAIPKHLSREARAEWQRLGPALVKLGILTEVDTAVFAGYCQAFARWLQAEQAIPARKMVYSVGTNGAMALHPMVGAAQKWHTQMLKYLIELGLTPASRSRLIVAQGGDAPSDPVLNLLD